MKELGIRVSSAQSELNPSDPALVVRTASIFEAEALETANAVMAAAKICFRMVGKPSSLQNLLVKDGKNPSRRPNP
jgi:hypothetical protein